jgi:hypothetical protein
MAPGTRDCQRLRGFAWAEMALAEEPGAVEELVTPDSVSSTRWRWLPDEADARHCAEFPGAACTSMLPEAVFADASVSVLLQGAASLLACMLPISMDISPACAVSANGRAKKLARTRLVIRKVMLRLRIAARD